MGVGLEVYFIDESRCESFKLCRLRNWGASDALLRLAPEYLVNFSRCMIEMTEVLGPIPAGRENQANLDDVAYPIWAKPRLKHLK